MKHSAFPRPQPAVARGGERVVASYNTEKQMKIGDKVRFLNDVGGGVVTGFKGKDLVLVADEDGFEVPTLINEVVVIETDDYNIARQTKATKGKKQGPDATDKPAPTSIRQALAVTDDEEEEPETDPADLETTFRPRAQERRGAEELNLSLAFVPADFKHFSDTPFEVYAINDCNYYIRYALYTPDGDFVTLRQEGELAPNTKVYLENVNRDSLEEWKRVTVQVFAYKRDKAFMLKPALSVALRIDLTRFYKESAFRPNDFFNEPSLLCPVVVDDKPVRELAVDAEKLEASFPKPEDIRAKEQPARVAYRGVAGMEPSRDPNAVIEVDLHADELLDTMVGLQPADILDYQIKVFRDTMNAHLKEKGRRLVFIHGKGEGVLRKELLRELKRSYPQCRWQDASFREYGYGATMVTI